MDDLGSAFWAIIVGSVLLTFWFVGMVAFNGSRRWFRFRKRIACVFGKHIPNTPEAAVGGRQIQRCLYCDVVVSEFTVSIDSIRRER